MGAVRSNDEQLASTLSDAELHLIGEGNELRLYDKLGAQLREVEGVLGTAFAVWAPNAKRVSVVGDFNDWDQSATPMTRRKNGSLAASVSLEPGRTYRFRYLLDDGRWGNDWDADDYVANDFGGEDSVVAL